MHVHCPVSCTDPGTGVRHTIPTPPNEPAMATTPRSIDRSVPARLRRVSGRLLLLVVVAVGCGPEAPEGVIDREVFIEAYVDLRIAALDAENQEIGEAARDAILASHGIEADDLLEFAEVHARDLELMRDVWNEVEVRMDAVRPDAEGR